MKKVFAVWLCAILMTGTVAMIGVNGQEMAQSQRLLAPHAPIRINSNADFPGNVTGGDGSIGNPWIIENYEIDGTGGGYGLYIGNTTGYVIARNCSFNNSNGVGSQPYFPDGGVVLYNATNIKVYNCTMYNNANFGAFVSYAGNVTISNCNASSNPEGVAFYNTNYSTIANCTMFDNADGIWFTQATRYNTVINNTAVGGSSSGILLNHAQCRNNTIINNNVSYSDEGIMIEYSNNNTISGNIAHNCTGWDAIWVLHSLNTIITDNVINGTVSGIAISYANYTYISNNSGLYNDVLIQIDYSNECDIIGNNASWCNQVGIYSGSPCNNNTISNNQAWNNTWHGIYWTAGQNNEISNNTASGNQQYGIYLADGNNVLDNNTVRYNTNGGFYVQSSGNNITRNTVSDNPGDGMYMMGSSNTVRVNEIANNSGYGLYLTGANINTIYHNNIVNNANQAYDDSTNNWNATYPICGNYWGDYSGVDTLYGPLQNKPGPDGIGDTPYTNIGGGSGAQDNYPWTNEDGWLNQNCTANDDTNITNEDTVLNVVASGVLANDTDPDSADVLTVVEVNGNPINGSQIPMAFNATLIQSADGSFVYNPNGSFEYLAVGEYYVDNYTYMLSDQNGSFDNATVFVNVTGVNDAPNATDDDSYIAQDDLDTIWVMLSDNGHGVDSDPDGDSLTVTMVNGNPVVPSLVLPSGATLTNAGGDVFQYWQNNVFDYLANGQSAYDGFNYTISDGNGGTDAAVVNITINGINDAPTISGAGGTLAYVEGDGPRVIDNSLTVTDVDDANLEGAWVNITANYQNTKDFLAFTNMGAIMVDAVSTADTLKLTGTATVANYELALETVTFENTANNPTPDPRTITWWVTDGETWSAGVNSTITMSEVNNPPVAVNDSGAGYQGNENTAFDTANVTVNDTDPENDTLTVFSLDTTGTIGQVTTNTNNTFNYNPNGQFEYLDDGDTGYDNFNYTISDGRGGFDTAMVTIAISGANDAPTVANLIPDGSTPEDALYTFQFAANTFSDPDDPLTYSATLSNYSSLPGWLAFNPGTRTFTGTPTNVDVGTISIRVTADDGTVNASDVFDLQVTNTNDAPILDPIGNKTVNEEALLAFKAWGNDTDLPANTLTFFLETPLAGASITAGGDFTWTPTEAQGPGFYNITINVTDNGSPPLNDSEKIMITVGEVNQAPDLGGIGPKSVDEGSLLSFIANAIDSDLPANMLTYSLWPGGAPGASISAGGVFIWTPSEIQGPGVYQVTVVVTDNGVPALNDTETISITVNEVNSQPVAADDAKTLNEDSGAVAVDVLANDNDPDGNTLTIISVTQGAHGNVTLLSGTSLTYRPAANYYGADSFTYTISDGNGLNDTAIVSVTVNNTNDNPVAADDAVTINEDSGSNIVYVLANDDYLPDPAENLLVAGVTQGAHGTVTIDASGAYLTYEPTANYFGVDSFTYTISDGNNGTATGTVIVTVRNVNDPPTIITSDVTTAIEENAYSVDYDATDIDQMDTLTWSLASSADWLAIDPATGVLSGTAEPGYFNVRVTVHDAYGDFDFNEFVLVVAQKDTDSDGIPDSTDIFPNDAGETADFDGDGTGDNADTDDDGDGASDGEDAFPNDADETLDTDGDGIGNSADTDDDGDMVPDADDPAPLDYTIWSDTQQGWPFWWVLLLICIILVIGAVGLLVIKFLV
jgi:parallel beta-helix repeat protein/VCBS repeat-containing protein